MAFYFGPYVEANGVLRPPVTVSKRGEYFAGLPLPARNGTVSGIFATHATIAQGYTPLGNWDSPATTAMRDALRVAFGVPNRTALTGTPQTLRELLLDAWQSWSDPAGLAGPKPLQPAGGRLTLALGQVLQMRWRWGDLGTARIQAVVHADRRDYAAAVAAGRITERKARQVLAADALRLRTGFCVLVPAGMTIKPERPQTSYTDTFDGTGALGASWEQTIGSGSLARDSGRIVMPAATSAEGYRYNADVSSADHWVTLADIVRSNGIGGIIRHSDSAVTCYRCYVSAATILDITKVVAGSPTSLRMSFNGPATDNVPMTFKAEGSTLTVLSGETSLDSISNGDISTGLRGGIYMQQQGPSADSWAVDDGVTPPSSGGQPRTQITTGLGIF